MPSPQAGDLQRLVQPSLLTTLPSSHSSVAGLTTWSPHTLLVQLFLHASFWFWLPSSHCSPACWKPSPQRAFWQPLVQASVFTRLPSSHCSPPSTTPLPHCGVTHDLV